MPASNPKDDPIYDNTEFLESGRGQQRASKGPILAIQNFFETQEEIKALKQIEASTKPNFEAVRTLNQSIRRYNQLFSGMMEITIAGDFSLHAGDVIFVDIFSVSAEKDDTLNRESGGLYIIADLCHYLDADATYTKLNLARDSFGRDGNHSKR